MAAANPASGALLAASTNCWRPVASGLSSWVSGWKIARYERGSLPFTENR